MVIGRMLTVRWLAALAALPAIGAVASESRRVPGFSDRTTAQAALREASAIALAPRAQILYWRAFALLDIGDAQTRAADFDGALVSLRKSGDPEAGLRHLAEAVARHGDRERALHILDLPEAHGLGQRGYVRDAVQWQWLKHRIASGDFVSVRRAIEQIAGYGCRSDALRELATARAGAGDAAGAADDLRQAVDAGAREESEFHRARSLWEAAGAQLMIGRVRDAKETLGRLVNAVRFTEPLVRVDALRHAAVISAKAGDKALARRLFRRALQATRAVNDMNRELAVQWIAADRARAGFITEALSMVRPGARELVLVDIAVKQVAAHDVAGAIRTALSATYYTQYRDDALAKIVERLLAMRDRETALTTTERFHNASRRAAAMLRVATAYARAGDSKTAAVIAGRIRLGPGNGSPIKFDWRRFDYRRPETWGILYEATLYFSMASHREWLECAAEVASEAMTLFQALHLQPASSFAALFEEVTPEEVTRALARAHAATGNVDEALEWARQIGRGDSTSEPADGQSARTDLENRAIERRVQALLGVAQGMLDRAGVPETARSG